MVLITSTIGAAKNYPNREMFKMTTLAFLHSLRRQTDRGFRLFLSGHERPDFLPDDPWIDFHSIGDAECETNLVAEDRPRRPGDPAIFVDRPFEGKMADMSRKSYDSVIRAGQWAWKNRLEDFWILRMDSDDLLWNGYVALLNKIPAPTGAVWCRNVHLFDPRSAEIGVQRLPYPATCNALRYRFKDDGSLAPDWYFHCNDHSKFAMMARQAQIPALEINWSLCIVTGSGNSISGRGGIDAEKWARKIGGGRVIDEMYGLETFQGVNA